MKSHTCSICGKILASPQSLWNHKQRHSREDKSENSKYTALADVTITDPFRNQFDKTADSYSDEDPPDHLSNSRADKSMISLRRVITRQIGLCSANVGGKGRLQYREPHVDSQEKGESR